MKIAYSNQSLFTYNECKMLRGQKHSFEIMFHDIIFNSQLTEDNNGTTNNYLTFTFYGLYKRK